MCVVPADVNSLLSVLLTRKREMESETKYEEIELLLEFLYMTKQQTDTVRVISSPIMLLVHLTSFIDDAATAEWQL